MRLGIVWLLHMHVENHITCRLDGRLETPIIYFHSSTVYVSTACSELYLSNCSHPSHQLHSNEKGSRSRKGFIKLNGRTWRRVNHGPWLHNTSTCHLLLFTNTTNNIPLSHSLSCSLMQICYSSLIPMYSYS